MSGSQVQVLQGPQKQNASLVQFGGTRRPTIHAVNLKPQGGLENTSRTAPEIPLSIILATLVRVQDEAREKMFGLFRVQPRASTSLTEWPHIKH